MHLWEIYRGWLLRCSYHPLSQYTGVKHITIWCIFNISKYPFCSLKTNASWNWFWQEKYLFSEMETSFWYFSSCSEEFNPHQLRFQFQCCLLKGDWWSRDTSINNTWYVLWRITQSTCKFAWNDPRACNHIIMVSHNYNILFYCWSLEFYDQGHEVMS